jgi:hypothetical protein
MTFGLPDAHSWRWSAAVAIELAEALELSGRPNNRAAALCDDGDDFGDTGPR